MLEFEVWWECDLEEIYFIVWLDVIYYKIKENGCYVSKVIYIIFVFNIDGKKELLGLYLLDNEGVYYWFSVLIDFYNCGVKDILIVCVDGLKGFFEVIESVYFKIEV